MGGDMFYCHMHGIEYNSLEDDEEIEEITEPMKIY